MYSETKRCSQSGNLFNSLRIKANDKIGDNKTRFRGADATKGKGQAGTQRTSKAKAEPHTERVAGYSRLQFARGGDTCRGEDSNGQATKGTDREA